MEQRGSEPGEVAPDGGRHRLALFVTLALVAVLIVLGARTEPVASGERVGRRVELAELIAAEQERVEGLERQVEELAEEINEHEATAARGEGELDELRAAVEEMAVPAGATAVRGPGVRISLDDSLGEWDGTDDPNNYIIHEEDLRAVVNALWAGGAEAMAINGQRVLSTTAIVCVGTTLRLNGAYYTPPYDITVIGEADDLVEELQEDPAVEPFLSAVEEYELGLDIETSEAFELPGHTGATNLDASLPSGGP